MKIKMQTVLAAVSVPGVPLKAKRKNKSLHSSW
ncbi:Uncharacterised protein [Klebsiella pneumoniae]|nr:Uncharacterised protein [Klebsiella pneumoniae]